MLPFLHIPIYPSVVGGFEERIYRGSTKMEVPLINAKRAQIVADDGEYLGFETHKKSTTD